MDDIVFVYVTHPDADAALALGRKLVEEGLAGCANVLSGMRTVYRWQGHVEEGSEPVMIVKARADLMSPCNNGLSRSIPTNALVLWRCPSLAETRIT